MVVMKPNNHSKMKILRSVYSIFSLKIIGLEAFIRISKYFTAA